MHLSSNYDILSSHSEEMGPIENEESTRECAIQFPNSQLFISKKWHTFNQSCYDFMELTKLGRETIREKQFKDVSSSVFKYLKG
jgi:hypothetical protein